MEQFDCHWTDFHECFLVFFEYLKKPVKNQLTLKSDIMKGIVQEDICTFIIPRSLLLRMKNVSQKIFHYISNKMQCYTVYFIWKLLYMFRVVPPPIIRSANNCIYSIWYLSHRYCYLSISWKIWNCKAIPNLPGSSNGVTNTRCCRYSCLRS